MRDFHIQIFIFRKILFSAFVLSDIRLLYYVRQIEIKFIANENYTAFLAKTQNRQFFTNMKRQLISTIIYTKLTGWMVPNFEFRHNTNKYICSMYTLF